MNTYSIETLSYSAMRVVWLDGRKVALLFQPMIPGEPWTIYPNPDAFPGLAFEGLPDPLKPQFMDFASLAAVEAYLGIQTAQEAEAA